MPTVPLARSRGETRFDVGEQRRIDDRWPLCGDLMPDFFASDVLDVRRPSDQCSIGEPLPDGAVAEFSATKTAQAFTVELSAHGVE